MTANLSEYWMGASSRHSALIHVVIPFRFEKLLAEDGVGLRRPRRWDSGRYRGLAGRSLRRGQVRGTGRVAWVRRAGGDREGSFHILLCKNEGKGKGERKKRKPLFPLFFPFFPLSLFSLWGRGLR